MYLGRICERGTVAAVFDRPRHHYTRGLLAAVPNIKTRTKQAAKLGGEVPSPLRPPGGCPFHPRCPAASDRCRNEVPRLLELPTGQLTACHHPLPAGDVT
jgi:peptide/nickel transport system ATP-binding protein